MVGFKMVIITILFITYPIFGQLEIFRDNVKSYCIRKAITEGNQYNMSRNSRWIVECVHYYPDSVRINAIMDHDTLDIKYIRTIYASDKNIFSVKISDVAIFKCDNYPYYTYPSWAQSLDTVFVLIKGSTFNLDKENWEVSGIDVSSLRPDPTTNKNTHKTIALKRLKLSNRPNPFSSLCTIEYVLPENDYVAINIYSSGGRLIRVLGQERQNKGLNSVLWDGTDNNGHKLANGRYYYQVISGNYIGTKKMVLLK